MGEPRHWHLLLYDVSDDKRLRQVRKLLCAWGKPLQYSVFRVRATAREMERLRFELTRLLDRDDRLTVVRLCGGCASRVQTRGKELAPFELDKPPFEIV